MLQSKLFAESALSHWRDYYELCKPKVVMVMLLTAVVGMFLAEEQVPSLTLVLWATLGIGLVSGGAAAVNHVLDNKIDAQMYRTRRRPLPEGRLSQRQALGFALGISVLGLLLLLVFVNPLTAVLTLFASLGYAVVYTVFLKRATPQNIVIGGIAGAAPPLLGWVAVTGNIDANSLLLVLIIFAWTPPHFWSLCLARKADYQNAEIPMLPVTHGERYTKIQILLYSLLMVATTALPYLTGMSGLIYLIGISVLNIRFIHWAWRVWKDEPGSQMAMFRYSIYYIMWLFVVLLLDHYSISFVLGL